MAISDYVNGVFVKDGRLINARPNGKSGIEQAAELRKMVKHNKKVDIIAEGIERAEMRKDFFK